MSDFIGPPRAPTGTQISPNWAIAAAVFSSLSQAYAGYAAVRTAQYEAKSQASALGHRARMLELDRRDAQRRAFAIEEQGRSQVANVTLEGQQRRGAALASAAAAGVDASSASAREVQASDKLIDAIDVYHINLGTVRAANAARAGAVAIENEAAFARTNARGLRRSARYARPEAHLLAGLASAASSAEQIYNYRRA